jgi:hypothetical protein
MATHLTLMGGAPGIRALEDELAALGGGRSSRHERVAAVAAITTARGGEGSGGEANGSSGDVTAARAHARLAAAAALQLERM